MSTHTPGPWNILWVNVAKDPRDNSAASIETGTGSIIALNLAKKEHAEGNARLIAAAPDLLAACNRALTELAEPVMLHVALPRICAELRAAIAKAEGT